MPLFLERAGLAGAAGLELRSEPVTALISRGRVTRFGKAQATKLRATGVAQQGAPLGDGAFYVDSSAEADRLVEAFRSQGLSPEKKRFQGTWVVDLGKVPVPKDLSAGFDDDLADKARAVGLVPVFTVATPSDLRLALERTEGATIRFAPGLADLDGLADAVFDLKEDGAWLAWDPGSEGAKTRRRASVAADGELSRVLAAAELPKENSATDLLRLVEKDGAGLVLVAIEPEGIEEQFKRLRTLSRAMRDSGHDTGFPPAEALGRRVSGVEWLLRWTLGGLLVFLAPLFAIRAGLSVLRKGAGRLQDASPFLEGAAAALAVLGVSAAAGSAAHLFWDTPIFRLGVTSLPGPGTFAGAGALLSAAALYLPELERKGEVPSLLKGFPALAAVLFLVLLANPAPLDRAVASVAGMIFGDSPSWWWTAARWRSLLVAVPCLFTGLFLYGDRLAGRGQPDPRPFLLLASFAPAQAAAALALGAAGLVGGLSRTGGVGLFGLVLGLGFYGLGKLPRMRRPVVQ